jgi:predicted acylesterase/phospholipase RssA
MVETQPSKGSKYADPSRSCDIVMKGGITSGVVYPRAVCELAESFRFRNIGGTSAGAIAAAAAAAAEYGRDAEGFERLDELPEWIGADGNLTSLFQAQPSTRGLFKIVLAKVKRNFKWAIFVAVARNLPVVLLGALPAVALFLLTDPKPGWETVVAWAALLFLAVLSGAAALLAFLAVRIVWSVPDNGFGLCSGWTESFEKTERDPAPLTPWLYRTLNEYASLDRGEPLTFGHLWAGPDGNQATPPADPKDRHVDLAMMTTNLTNRRAHQLPLRDDDDQWYFSPAEFGRLFPAEVVKWMREKSPDWDPADPGRSPLRLPSARDMPVIVATRMSLSFPILLSAVPLWRVDESRVPPGGGSGQPPSMQESVEPERCWFSDGGISSNFPIHFFDRLIPRWPTFAINLRPFRDDREESTDERLNTRMVEAEDQKVPDWWYRIPEKRSLLPYKDRRLADFLTSIGKTMQNRVDEAQMQVPGYRDRIAHVSMSKDEGGMNLSMEKEVIEKLIERGRLAAARLATAYTSAPGVAGVTWDSHRWTRLRSTLAVLEEMHARFADGYSGPVEPDGVRTYAGLIGRTAGEPPPDFPWGDDQQRALAEKQVDAIIAAVALQTGHDPSLATGAPSPAPEGRIEPRL